MTIETLARYLGRPVDEFLSDVPFKFWRVEKSYENDLDEPVVDFVFPQDGVQLSCDGDETLRTIFLEAEEFDEHLLGFPFSLCRQQVLERFGKPTRSGEGHIDAVLGAYGAWDRFDGAQYCLHIQYRPDADCIKKVTLMRPDVAP